MTPFAAIHFEPMAPSWVVAALTGVLLALALRSARAPLGPPLAAKVSLALRLAGANALTLLMLGIHDAQSPTAPPPTPAEKPPLTVLLDASASMLTCDAGNASRLDYVRRDWLNEKNLARASRRFDLACRTFDSTLRDALPLTHTPIVDAQSISKSRDANRTKLLAALMRAVGDTPAGSGLLIITDGHDNDDSVPCTFRDVAALALARGVTLHTVAVGESSASPALLLTAESAQRSLRPGQPGHVHAFVRSVGTTPSTQIELKLEPPNAAPITLKTVTDAEGNARAWLPFTPPADHPDEQNPRALLLHLTATAGNLRATADVVVNLEARRERVIYIEADPSFESAFLARSLRSDPRLSVVTVIAVTPGEKPDIATNDDARVAALPRTAEEWAEFDAVILGKRVESVLDEAGAAKLAASLRLPRRPQLILARARPFSENAPPRVREMLDQSAGLSWPTNFISGDPSRVILTEPTQSRPALRLWSQITDARPQAASLHDVTFEVLATADNQPFLAASRGVVVVTDGSAWLGPLTIGSRLDSLACDLVHWAISRRDDLAELGLQADSPATVDHASVVRVTSAGSLTSAPELTVTPPGQPGAATPVMKDPRGGWTASFTPTTPGVHQLRVDAVSDGGKKLSATTLIVVAQDRAERVFAAARPEMLHALAQETHGLALDSTQAASWPELLEAQSQATRHATTVVTSSARPVRPPGPTWIDGGLIVVLLTALAGEWFVRRAAFPDRS